MSKTKFTPEPWETELATGIEYENFRCIKAGVGYFSMTGGDPNGGFNLTGFISKENADLITAAPDLYRELHEAIEMLEFMNHATELMPIADKEMSIRLSAANAALAKARGE